MRHIHAIGLRQSGRHAPLLTLPRFAGGISTTRDKVTGEITQAGELLASAANSVVLRATLASQGRGAFTIRAAPRTAVGNAAHPSDGTNEW